MSSSKISGSTTGASDCLDLDFELKSSSSLVFKAPLMFRLTVFKFLVSKYDLLSIQNKVRLNLRKVDKRVTLADWNRFRSTEATVLVAKNNSLISTS